MNQNLFGTLTLFFILILSTSQELKAKTIYVDASKGFNNGNGTSWANAYGDVQRAIDEAAPTDEIWVRAGTYRPTYRNNAFQHNDHAVRSGSIVIDTNIKLYGGFVGTETSRAQRDHIKNPTIFSGAEHLNHHVLFIDGRALSATNTAIDANCKIVGIQIRKGNACCSPLAENYRGAGIYIYAKGSGGGASPQFLDCVIADNRTSDGSNDGDASAIYIDGEFGIACSPEFNNCLINSNISLGFSTAIRPVIAAVTSSPKFINCTIAGNAVDINAYYFLNSGGTSIWNSILTDQDGSNPPINTSNIATNHSIIRGAGGVGLSTDEDPQFISGFRLGGCSPAINTGANSFNTFVDTDLAGNPRKIGTIDMGCYEHQPYDEPCIIPCSSRPNAALSYDGVKDYASISPKGWDISSNTHTLEAWLYYEDSPSYRSWPFHLGLNSAGSLHWLLNSNGTLTVGMWGGGQLHPPIETYRWTHIASVYDGSKFTVYVNGEKFGEVIEAGVNFATAGVSFGINYDGSLFKGKMDEVRMWNVPRTEEQIKQNLYSQLSGTEYGLFAYYSMDEGMAGADNTGIPHLTDYSGNDNNVLIPLFTRSGTASNFTEGRLIQQLDINNNNTPDICEYDCSPILYHQWGSMATASSHYTGFPGWEPSQATGPPSFSDCGDFIYSWAPATNGTGPEWLQVNYTVPVRPLALRVHETNLGAFITKIELVDLSGTKHNVWEGTDTTLCNGYFELALAAPPSYLVNAVIIHTAKPGYEEIESVQLVGLKGTDLTLPNDVISTGTYYGPTIKARGTINSESIVQLIADGFIDIGIGDILTANQGASIELSIGNCVDD